MGLNSMYQLIPMSNLLNTLVEGSVCLTASLPTNCIGAQVNRKVIHKGNQQLIVTDNRIQVVKVDTKDACRLVEQVFPFSKRTFEEHFTGNIKVVQC